jgi:hypothetical protein
LESLATQYATDLVRLDPTILDLLELVAEGELDKDSAEFVISVQNLGQAVTPSMSQLEELVSSMEAGARVSRTLRSPIRRMQAAVRGIIDGITVIDKWRRRAEEIDLPKQEEDAEPPQEEDAERPSSSS